MSAWQFKLKKWVKTTKNSSVKKTENNVQEKKSEIEEKKEVHRCDECKWYDVSTQRDFFRKVGPRDESGQRTTIKEIRAICRSPKSKAKGHLVKSDSDRSCFEKGKYASLEKPKKETNKAKKNEEKMTSPEEYFGTPEERLKTKSRGSKLVSRKQSNHSARKKKVVATNVLNNQTEVLQQRGKRVFIAANTTSTLR